MATAADHPVPHRIYHWINLISMVVLTLTGLYIHKPWTNGWMAEARWMHFTFMYIIIVNILARVYYAFFGKNADWRVFGFGKEDFGNAIKTAKYYLFIGPEVDAGKYNPMQRAAYFAVPFLILFQAYTGFAIYYPNEFQASLDAMGGLANVRAVHFLFMWVFIAFTIFHAYLAMSHWGGFMVMMFGVETEKDGMVHGEEGLDLGSRKHSEAR